MGINTTLLFFLLLVPLSGFIAWAGDRVGHRVGKRRHSLFGLRPRHTATLITVGAGIGISLLSFGLMFASSAGFRAVLAHGTTLLQINRTLQKENERLARAEQSAEKRVGALREASRRADAERLAAEKAQAEATQRRDEAETNYRLARTRLAAAARALAQERQRLGGAQRALRVAEDQVRNARRRLADAEAARKTAQTAVLSARRDAAAARAKVAQAERTFQEVTQLQSRRLASQREQLSAQGAQLGAQSARLESQSRQMEDQNTTLARQRAELERLSAEVARLEKRRDEYQVAVDELLRSTNALRGGRITYRVGEEVARLSIPPGSNIWRLQNQLEGLLTAAAKKAEARGARSGADALRAVAIPTRQADKDAVTEFDAVREAALSIRRANEDVVVVVIALANAVLGEPVPVDLRTFRNPRILAAGEALGATILDGTRSRQEVADALYGFLQREIRPRLVHAGAIPPSLTLGDPGEASLVTLSGNEWLQVMDEVKMAGHRARLTVRAARDLRAADPIALTFEVKSLDTDQVAGTQ